MKMQGDVMNMNLVPYSDREHGAYFAEPTRKVGHMRCYFTANNEVMSTFFSAVKELQTKKSLKEIMKVTSELTRSEFMKSFETMRAFCTSHPEARTGDDSSGEYTFFSDREYLRCWIRFILRRGDYNCYIHCYVKE